MAKDGQIRLRMAKYGKGYLSMAKDGYVRQRMSKYGKGF